MVIDIVRRPFDKINRRQLGMVGKTETKEIISMDVSRVWKSLDAIGSRLTDIDTKLDHLVRLDERVKQHDELLEHHSTRIDRHSKRLRDSELWQAGQGDKSSTERLIHDMQRDLSRLDDSITKDIKHIQTSFETKVDNVQTKLDTKLSNLKSTSDVNKGHKDITANIFKWLSALLTAVIIWKFKSGS